MLRALGINRIHVCEPEKALSAFVIVYQDGTSAKIMFLGLGVGTDNNNAVIPVPGYQVAVPFYSGQVEVGCRLIEQQQRRVAEDGQGQFDALLHAGGEIPDRFVPVLRQGSCLYHGFSIHAINELPETVMEGHHLLQGELFENFQVRPRHGDIAEDLVDLQFLVVIVPVDSTRSRVEVPRDDL